MNVDEKIRNRLVLPCASHGVDEFLSEPTEGVLRTVSNTEGPLMIVGAGGKMGLHLGLMLRRTLERLGRNDRIIAVSRFNDARRRAEFLGRGIEILPCDLVAPGAVESLPLVPTLFFMAGLKFGTANDRGALQATNVHLPERIAKRFAHARTVAFSSGCVYPFVSPASGGATENTVPEPIGDYASSCLAREQAFARVSSLAGSKVALIRLNYSVEFRYGVLVDIALKVLAGAPVDVTMGHVNFIWQRDAVANCIQALDLAGSPAVPVNVTGPEIHSVRALARRFGEIFDRPVTIVGREAETAWLNQAAWSHRLFGLPPTGVAQMIEWTSAWLAHKGETWSKPTGFERRDGQF